MKVILFDLGYTLEYEDQNKDVPMPCTNRNRAMRAILNLQSRGISEDRILHLNNMLENNGYKDMKSRV